VHLGHIGLRLACEPAQRLQPAGDVLQRRGLQLGSALQGLHEQRQRRLDGLAALGEAVEEPGAVEIAQG
jgi:hypothetical protein